MRTITAYFLGLLLGLLWIMAGYGISSAASPDTLTPRTEKIEQLRAQGTLTIADLQQNIRFFDHPGQLRINVPERSNISFRYPAPVPGSVPSLSHTDANTRIRCDRNLSSQPHLFSRHPVDYHVFALRKILI